MRLNLQWFAVILCLIAQETISNQHKNGFNKKKMYYDGGGGGAGGGDGGMGGGNVIYCVMHFHRCTMQALLSKGVKIPKKQVMCLLNSQNMQCVGQEITMDKDKGKSKLRY